MGMGATQSVRVVNIARLGATLTKSISAKSDISLHRLLIEFVPWLGKRPASRNAVRSARALFLCVFTRCY